MSQKVDLKCVMLGRSNVGKTCLVDRFLHDRWASGHVPTVGAAFGARDIMVNKKKFTVGVWDTAGSERYESMTRHYYHKAQGAVVCYDLTDAASFEKVKFWVRELNAVEESVIVAVVGCKLDLVEEGGQHRAVQKNVAMQYCKSINAQYYECSAKTGKNVDGIFVGIVTEFGKASAGAAPKAYDPNILQLSNQNTAPKEEQKKCC